MKATNHWITRNCKVGSRKSMPKRTLGKTGYRISLFSLGGQSMIEAGESEKSAKAVDVVHEALDLGVNYVDTAAIYGDGKSEHRIGEVIKDGRRNDFYLATKTDQRDEEAAWKQINESIGRLGTTPDCMQIHHLDTMEEVDKIFSKNGAMNALLRARDGGLCKFLGITGHSDPTVLIEALNRHDFDTVLGALNPADPYCYSFQPRLLPFCEKKRIGFVAMKICSRGKIFEDNDLEMKDCLEYAWSVPGVSTAIVGISNIEQLRKNVTIAKSYEKLSLEKMYELEKRVEPRVEDILYFRKPQEWNDFVHDHPEKLPKSIK